MSSRHRPNRPDRPDCQDRPFDENLPELTAAEANSASAGDTGTMHDLHLASQNVLRLATQTYNAAARGDERAAHAARASLEKQLGLATHLIDEILSAGDDQPTMH